MYDYIKYEQNNLGDVRYYMLREDIGPEDFSKYTLNPYDLYLVQTFWDQANNMICPLGETPTAMSVGFFNAIHNEGRYLLSPEAEENSCLS